MRFAVALLLTALVSACASPRERCIRAATQGLRTVDALIAETEATLARGYAYRTEPAGIAFGLNYCAYSGGNIGFGFCSANGTATRQRPVAVDIGEERRKLAELKQRRGELAAQSAPAVAACGAAS